MTSNYDVNVQLALATTAELEGDLDTTLEFLAEAHSLSNDSDRFRVRWATARFHARNLGKLPMIKQLSLRVLASAF